MESLGPEDPYDVAGYHLHARLGAGGMGSVYLSYTRGGQPVAFKVVRRELAEDPEFRRRFEREVAAVRRVHSAYIAPVLDSNTEGPTPWLAGAYVAGPPLSDAVAGYGPLPVASVLTLTAGVAEALQAIHASGVVHRDLKPSNVLLAADGPRVIDFGIAQTADGTALTRSNVLVGTPAYMSPEQVLGRPVGPAGDVFSLGLLAHFAATGEHPFGDGNAQALMFRISGTDPDLTACPPDLRDIVAACLAKDPGERPLPADIAAACRTAAAHAEPGTWLPPALAAEARSRAAPPEGTAAAPSIPPPPTPDMDPTVSVSPPAATSVLPDDTQPIAADPPDRRRRWPWIAAGAAVLAVAVTAAVVVPTLLDDGKGGKSDDSSAWTKVKSEVPFTISAPDIAPTGYFYNGYCMQSTATYVYLAALAVVADSRDVPDNEVPPTVTLKYGACYTAVYASPGDPITAELRLLDGRGVLGGIDARDPSPEDCRDAARRADIPNVITLEQIRTDSVLHKDRGICVETADGTVVFLWINQAHEIPGTQGLRTYAMTATQWKPATQGTQPPG